MASPTESRAWPGAKNPTRKRNKQGDASVVTGVDRISNLPESIICHILSFLPTKYAMATSVLSKSWEFVWTKVPTLDFEDGLFIDPHNVDEYEDSQIMKFVQFINKVLLNRDPESMDRFRLKWEQFQSVYVGMWVRNAIARNVCLLELDLCKSSASADVVFHLPGAFFNSGTLESLILAGPIFIKTPPKFCLPKLADMNLIDVKYESDESVRKLISSCPVLDSLKIERTADDNATVYSISSSALRSLVIYFGNDYNGDYNYKLEIDAPALEHLVLRDYMSFDFSVRGINSLNKAVLEVNEYYNDMEGFRCNVVKLVESMQSAKSLTLGAGIMMCLDFVTSARLSARFERLTELEIDCGCSCCLWNSIMDVVESSYRLRVLGIKNGKGNPFRCQASWRPPAHVPSCFLQSLVGFSLREFEGLGDDIKMIEYVLKHALVMRKVELRSAVDPRDIKRKFHVLRMISKFSRASASCEITFD